MRPEHEILEARKVYHHRYLSAGDAGDKLISIVLDWVVDESLGDNALDYVTSQWNTIQQELNEARRILDSER